MLTKKIALIISTLIGAGFLILEPIKTSTICGKGNTSCVDQIFSATMIFFVFPFVFFFSLITYFLPDTVFRGWSKFVVWWVPLQMLLVAITPESAPGALVDLLPQQTVAILLSGLFAIISLIIIVWKYISFRLSGSPVL